MVIQSSTGTYEFDPTRWGNWDDAWRLDSTFRQTIIPSPDGSHYILIENHMWIVRKFDGNPIGLIGDVPNTVRWTSDGSAVMFAITQQEAELEPGLYAWPVESPNPHIVLPEQSSSGRVLITPSGTRAAYLVHSDAPGDLTLRLVDLPQGEAETHRLDLSQEWQLEGWVTDDLLVLSRGITSPSFIWYNVETRAIHQVQDSRALASTIPPLPSPDGQWVAGHSIHINANETGEMTTTQVENEYFVTNLETDENYNLAYGSDSAIEYLAWSPDSRRLLLVSCPTHEDAQAFDTAPFGLLAYEPEAETPEVLFAKAFQASISPTQQWAYVAFPSLDSNDERLVSGALWEIGSQALQHRRVLLEDIVYRDPHPNNGHRTPSYFYARWSHDGQTLVVVDPSGNLMLYGLDGRVELLQADLFGNELEWTAAMHDLNAGGLYWSPDDRFLLVNYQGLYLFRLD